MTIFHNVNALLERRKLFKILGASLVLSEGAKGISGAMVKAKELNEKIKNSFIIG
jgi:cysteine synthase A